MTQKVIKVGSSAAAVLPKESMKKLGMNIGDEINVEIDERLGRFIIEPAEPVMADKELISWTRRFIKKYRSALEELADK